MLAMLRFELDDLTRPEIIALLEEHVQDMSAVSPPESVHALDLDGLQSGSLNRLVPLEVRRKFG